MRKLMFMRCKCGKIHTVGGIGHTTKCACGELLFPQIAPPPIPHSQKTIKS